MSKETTDNFWSAFASLEPIKPPDIFYRLYYDSNGRPLFYTMEDLPGNYIEVDQTVFAESPSDVKVINGQLKKVAITASTKKLVPADSGTCCHVTNVSIVVDNTQPNTKWKLKTYDEEN